MAFDINNGAPLAAADYPLVIAQTASFELSQAGTEIGINTVTPSSQTVQDVANAILAAYPLTNYANPDDAVSAVQTDLVFSCPSKLADVLLSLSVPVYAYEFNDENAPMVILPPVSFPYAASHTSELQYLFNVPEFFSATLSTDEQTLSSSMQLYWSQFVKTGNPNSSSKLTPSWPGYNGLLGLLLNDDIIQSLTPPTPSTESNFNTSHHCSLWTDILAASAFSDIASEF